MVGGMRTALERALEGLPPDEGDALRRRYFTGQTLAQAAQETGVSIERVRQMESHGLKALRHPKASRSLREFMTPYYFHVGVSRFNTTGTSAVEEIVFRRGQMLRNVELGKTCVRRPPKGAARRSGSSSCRVGKPYKT